MTDRELLELAAKAAGYDFITVEEHDTGDWIAAWKGQESIDWNPLTDDGDAFRLAVKLQLLDIHDVGIAPVNVWEGECPYAATRREIVLAAAAIGRTM